MEHRYEFDAPEHRADGSVGSARYRLEQRSDDRWAIAREGTVVQELGLGYRAIRVSHCGVCSTDLARHHLPFPLPQITGHEVVAIDDDGQPVAVEINASDIGRGLPRTAWCEFCRAGMPTHCPDRLVLGIHGLPGGFAPRLLAPSANVVPLPDGVDPVSATLLEPFAAAWHAVTTIAPDDGDRVAVLGPRRLGSLVIAALASWRARTGRSIEISAVVRRRSLGRLARILGADEVIHLDGKSAPEALAEIVVDTTGSPDGLAVAMRLATREVHLKSTNGLPTLGLGHATELVVDELSVVPFRPDLVATSPSAGTTVVAILDPTADDAAVAELERRGLRILRGADAARLRAELARDPDVPLDGADVVLASSLAQVDAAIRPDAALERPLIRPRGIIAIAAGAAPEGLLAEVLGRGIRVTTSRCGDFRTALPVLAELPGILGTTLGDAMVTSVLPAADLAAGYAAARDPQGLKVVMTHPEGLL